MWKKLVFMGPLFLPVGAMAQQVAPDPAFMQRAISALQTQRNSALDAQAVAEAKAVGLIEDLAKANATIKEFQDSHKEGKEDKQ